MSVIVAIASDRDGIVASDGRVFESAQINSNGQIVQPVNVESDSFDKTFSLGRGRIVGAFAGLMKFSGQTIAEHIKDIVDGFSEGYTDLPTIVDEIESGMKTRLQRIDEQDVHPLFTKLDLLLVAGRNLARSRFMIACVSFIPQNRVIYSSKDFVAVDRTNCYHVRGEDKALIAADLILRQNRAPNRDTKFLKKLAASAVAGGIRAAGTYRYGSAPACGGQVFTKCNSYECLRGGVP